MGERSYALTSVEVFACSMNDRIVSMELDEFVEIVVVVRVEKLCD
jgi:hypothetical protein